MLEKAGFQKEGVRRKAFLSCGVHRDTAMWSLLFSIIFINDVVNYSDFLYAGEELIMTILAVLLLVAAILGFIGAAMAIRHKGFVLAVIAAGFQTGVGAFFVMWIPFIGEFMLLAFGVIALIKPVAVNRALVRWEIPFMIGISAVTYYIGIVQREAGHTAGLVLLILFGVYMVHCMKSPPVPVTVEDSSTKRRYSTLIFLAILGCAGLGIGGVVFVKGAQEIARTLGVSEAVIGLTVVALGTSLPELITSVIAILKGNSDISLGNIVGSNIFNILLVIGATATIHPYSISQDRFLTLVGLPVMMGLAVVLLPFSMTGSRISRAEGGIFFLVCTGYYVLAVLMA